ncbi:MAG: hypothetical protein ACT4SY_03615 [Hyphomicrobiales bacterium]
MKKIVLSLAAIAALSTAAIARDDRSDLRDLHPEYFASTSTVTVQTAPMAIEPGALTAFERTKLTTERDEGGPR